MRSEEAKRKLIDEFPELEKSDVILEKEVFAHFGLTFMKFGLVEHSLVNIIVFNKAAHYVDLHHVDESDIWETVVDAEFKNAVTLTFGNLVRKISVIPEFIELSPVLVDAKRLRDYFAHHFMREESQYLATTDGCWLLLSRISDVRKRILSLEEILQPRFAAMCRRLRISLRQNKPKKN